MTRNEWTTCYRMERLTRQLGMALDTITLELPGLTDEA